MPEAARDTPTVIVLVSSTRSWIPDSVLKQARTVASGLGYAFRLHAAGELRRLIDRRHAAVYHVTPIARGDYHFGDIYLRLRGKHAVFCAKLHHDNHKRCIFHCNYRNQTTLKEMM